jgi:hypothetical protein
VEPKTENGVVDCIVMIDRGNSLIPLLRFHLRVGVRLAMRSFAPLFAGFLAAIILQMYPAAFVREIAAAIFGQHPDPSVLLAFAGLSFGFSFSAVPRLAHGLNGWMRHLNISGTANRRGLTLALIMVQFPLVISLLLLVFVAFRSGLNPVNPVLLRLALIPPAAALASITVTRRPLTVLFSVAAAWMALFGPLRLLFVAAGLLVAAEFFSGELNRPLPRMRRPIGAAFFASWIAQRAVGHGIAGIFIATLVPLAGTMLFLANNPLPDPIRNGAVRLGGCLSILFCVSAGASRLAVRRPVWPWVRSLPWSGGTRVLGDAFFLSLVAVPALIIVAIMNLPSTTAVVAIVPTCVFRSIGHVRRSSDRRVQAGGILVEGFSMAALIALIPWTAAAFLVLSIPAFHLARKAELDLKATRWSERHHLPSGDSLSWSA